MSIPPPPPSFGQQVRDWWSKSKSTQQMQGQHGQMGAQRTPAPGQNSPFPNPLHTPMPGALPAVADLAITVAVGGAAVIVLGAVGLPLAAAVLVGAGVGVGFATWRRITQQGSPATAACACLAGACLAGAVALPGGIGGPGVNDHLAQLGAVAIRADQPQLSTKEAIEQAAREWLDTQPGSAQRVGQETGPSQPPGNAEFFARDADGKLLRDENGNLILTDVPPPGELDLLSVEPLADFTLPQYAPPNLLWPAAQQENLPETLPAWPAGTGGFFETFTGTPEDLAELLASLPSASGVQAEEGIEVNPELDAADLGFNWGDLGQADLRGNETGSSGWGGGWDPRNLFAPGDQPQGWEVGGFEISRRLIGVSGVACQIKLPKWTCTAPENLQAALQEMCAGEREFLVQCPSLQSVSSTPARPVLETQAIQAGTAAAPVSILVNAYGGARWDVEIDAQTGICQPFKMHDDPIVKVHTAVHLSAAAVRWIEGDLQARFPEAVVRRPSFCTISGEPTAPPVRNGMRLQQHTAVSWHPPDPGGHEVTVTLISGLGAIVAAAPIAVTVDLLLGGTE